MKELEKLSNTLDAQEEFERLKHLDEPYDPLVTYLFVNKSLDMGVGKVAVQTARASQVMLLAELEIENTNLLNSLSELTENSFMKGNRTICLKANNNQMQRLLFGDLKDEILGLAKESNEHVALYPVFDFGKTEVETNSLTVIAMSPVKQSTMTRITRKFQLL